MSSPFKKNLLKYGISIGISILLAVIVVVTRVDGNSELVDWYLYLCDAFTIPGLLFLMFGVFMTLSNEGALDGVGYVAVNALKMLIPGGANKMERYKEYLERRRANRIKGYGFLYIVGAGCMAISLVFLVLFYTLYK